MKVPNLFSYLWKAYVYVLPFSVPITFLRHGTWQEALLIPLFFCGLAVFLWLGLFITSKLPDKLRRKLSQPVG